MEHFVFEINNFMLGMALGIGISISGCVWIFAGRKKEQKQVKTELSSNLALAIYLKAASDILTQTKKVITEEYTIKEISSGEIHTIKSENDYGLRYNMTVNTCIVYQLFAPGNHYTERTTLFLPASKIIKTKFKEIDIKPIGN